MARKKITEVMTPQDPAEVRAREDAADRKADKAAGKTGKKATKTTLATDQAQDPAAASSNSSASIEAELLDLLKTDRASWVRIFELMDRVDRESLWKSESCRSFTAWVNGMAEKAACHVSLLWERLKAGRAYAAASATIQATTGQALPTLAEAKLAPTTIVLAQKCAGKHPELLADLVQKAVDGDLDRADLSAAYKAKRAADGPRASRSSGTESGSGSGSGSRITAADVVLALRANINLWIPDHPSDFDSSKWKMIGEFAVDAGTTRSARRVDAMFIHNRTSPHKRRFFLDAVEIKVDKSDLTGDHKMAEYPAFCDQFWLAVPESLVDTAASLALPAWGILSIQDGKTLSIHRQAEHKPGARRAEALEAALYHLM